MKFIKDLFTVSNGEDGDLGRVIWAFAATPPILAAMAQGIAAVMSVFTVKVYLGLWTTADWTTWSTAIAALLLSGSGALFMKRGTEPSNSVIRASENQSPGAASSVVQQTQN